MLKSIVTGHEEDIAAVSVEIDAIKAEWDVMTPEQQEARKYAYREQFARDCAAANHAPFWALEKSKFGYVSATHGLHASSGDFRLNNHGKECWRREYPELKSLRDEARRLNCSRIFYDSITVAKA